MEAAAAITALLQKLAMLLTDEYKLHSGVRVAVAGLEDELTSMHAALEAAAPPAGHGDEPWARKLSELAYDADDAIESYLVRVSAAMPAPSSSSRRRPWRAALHAARRCKARRRIAAEIERIRSEVRAVTDRPPRSPPGTPVSDPRLHLHYENAGRLVGMASSTEELILRLSPEGDGGSGEDAPMSKAVALRVVALYGARGIGKTTLARAVYEKLRGKFECGAFVHVSQEPDMKSVLGRILRQVSQGSGENYEAWGEDEIIQRIRDALEDQRYFIVIDDVWNESVWKCLNCAQVQNTRGSKVITTTRNSDVAKLCLSPGCVDAITHEVCRLSSIDARNLFNNKAFGERGCTSKFIHISDQLLRKCDGLPLAIITIASVLTNKHRMEEWSSLYNSINAEHNPHLDDMKRIFSFSYNDLPSKLKPCLLYLSLYPDDYTIQKDDLIWRWIGEGLVDAKQDRSFYKGGEDYFNQLINRSLVQPVNFDAHGRVLACRVHDIVLSYIIEFSLQEKFVTIIGQHKQQPQQNAHRYFQDNKVRRLSFQNSKYEQTISQETLFHVRSLAIFCHAADLKLPFQSFQVLRVLNLEDCSGHNMEALPSTLVKLRRLVRLCVDRQTQLPEGIGNMLSLEEVSEVDTSKHPNLMEELGKLYKLRVLEMSLDTWDRRQREPLLKCLCNLKELQTLHLFAADVSLDFVLGNDWLWAPRHLQRFTVGIDSSQSENIFSLNPSSVWSEFSPFSRLPNWIKPSLNNLSELSIVVNTLPRKDLEILGALPALSSLDLHIIKACAKQQLEIFDKSADNDIQFRFLVNLKLVSRASGLVFRKQAMQRLQVLSLSFSVAETKYVHGDFRLGLNELTSLMAVDIGIDCRCATPWEVLQAEAAIRDSINSNTSHPRLDLRRHFERHTPWDIARENPEPEIIMQELPGVAKIGPWGGNRGRLHGINVAPHHLRSVIIRSCLVIDSLAFTYCDHNGQEHTAGPWGGSGGSEHKIHLDPGEFICRISGTTGLFGLLPNVVTSLQFTTNIRCYGPFGRKCGKPFDIPVQRNGCIVGFFARSGWYVDAIGVYVKLREEEFGPWGGDRGRTHDIDVAPHRLKRVTICSCFVIDSLEFSYIDCDGQCHSWGRWGGHGGVSNTVLLSPSEFLTGISGTIGQYEEHSNVITSLMLVTNARSYGSFGQRQGTTFHIPLQSNGGIVGFFGRADKYLNAIGVYTNHKNEITQQAGVDRIGPWGGNGGIPHYINAAPHHLESVTICSCLVIDSIAFSFRDHKGELHHAGPWGGCRGFDHKIQLEPSEVVVKLSGTIGAFGSITNVVTSLTLVTSAGRYGPYGQQEGTAFHIPVPSIGSIVGFFARAEEYINAIGIYVRTL